MQIYYKKNPMVRYVPFLNRILNILIIYIQGMLGLWREHFDGLCDTNTDGVESS